MPSCAAISITSHSRASPREQFIEYLQENLLDRFPGIVTRAQVQHLGVMRPALPADAVLPVDQPVSTGG